MIVNIGKGIELDVANESLPPAALEHVIRIGLRNILMDCHAGVNQKAMPDLSPEQVIEQSRAMAEKKLAALMAGEVRVAGTRGPSAAIDPVTAEMVKITKRRVLEALRAKGLKAGDYKDQMGRLMSQVADKYADSIRKEAEGIVALRSQNAADLDLSDL